MSFNVSINQSTNTIGKVDDTPFMNVSEYQHQLSTNKMGKVELDIK